MFLIDAYRARKLEKQRTRLLNEAYARRAANEPRHAGRERDERPQRGVRKSSTRPRTAPSDGRYGDRQEEVRYPFENDSLESIPMWNNHRSNNNRERNIRFGNVQTYASYEQRAGRHQSSDRAMPDIEPPYPRRVDSLPQRNGPANYHPRHGHRYLRPDEHLPHTLPAYIQPLSYGPRGPGETNGYRGRLFHDLDGGRRPARPPPRRPGTPPWVGPRPPGWI